MKTIVRFLGCAVLATVTVLFAGCTTTRTARSDARPKATQITYTLAIIRSSTFGDLTDAQWEQVRDAVAKFIDDEDHPVNGEYLLRVELAAAGDTPAGWADVKLTVKAPANGGLLAGDPMFNDYYYDFAGYYGPFEYRDYYPYELFPGRYPVPPPHFVPRHRSDGHDHDHDNDKDHKDDHTHARPGDPPTNTVAHHNPNDDNYHHRSDDWAGRGGNRHEDAGGGARTRDSNSSSWSHSSASNSSSSRSESSSYSAPSYSAPSYSAPSYSPPSEPAARSEPSTSDRSQTTTAER